MQEKEDNTEDKLFRLWYLPNPQHKMRYCLLNSFPELVGAATAILYTYGTAFPNLALGGQYYDEETGWQDTANMDPPRPIEKDGQLQGGFTSQQIYSVVGMVRAVIMDELQVLEENESQQLGPELSAEDGRY